MSDWPPANHIVSVEPSAGHQASPAAVTAAGRAQETLRAVALGVSGASGEALFRATVRYLSLALGVDFAFVGELVPGTSRVRTLAMAERGEVIDNLHYDIHGTPCEQVLSCGFQFEEEGIVRRYAGDNMLADLGLQGYAGYPLSDSGGNALGVIAILHRQPLRDRELIESTLRIFAVHASAELERVRTEAALRASEASYRAIFENSEDAIFVHDLETGAILDANPKACATYGYSCDEMRGLNVGAFSAGQPPYTLAGALQFIAKARAGEPQRFEWHRRNRDGSLHWDEVSLKRASLGGVDRIIALTREITDRKLREEALRKSEDRLRATVEAALDCILGMDTDGRIVEFNPAAERCFGHRREQVLGLPLADVLIPERYREAHRQGLQRWRLQGESALLGRRIEVTARRADGSEFPAELAMAVAQGPGGEVFVGYLRDITERKQAELARSRLEAQLRQARKMEAIGQLAGGIAHDFNNILTGVLGYVVMARERLEAQGERPVLQYLDRAERSAQRARDLIRQLLTFSRGGRGEARTVSLPSLVEDTLRLLGAMLPATIEIHTEQDPETPPIRIDPVQAEQVLMNLCINARDAMAGHGRLTVRVRPVLYRGELCASCLGEVAGRFVELEVRDTGTGIAPAARERLFEPFFTTKEAGRGSGMGLAVVHGIAHEGGGHVLLETAPGQGTSLRVLFRAADAAAEAGGPAAGSAAGPGRPAHLRGRVLLADDDEVAGGFLEDLLGSWGLTVVRARDGARARALYEEATEPFDLAVLDQSMPRVTGLELAAELQARQPNLPVLLHTGYAEGIGELDLRSQGVRALVHKPVHPRELFDLIGKLLRESAA